MYRDYMSLFYYKEVFLILVDYSSTIHRMIFASCGLAKPPIDPETGKYDTSKIINMIRSLILQELFALQQQHSNKYGELVICLDNSVGGYWRKHVYSAYKANRAGGKEKSDIDYASVFHELNIMMEQFKENLPWRVIDIQGAEADDIILVLAREFNKYENILIVSPDKDMIQSQRGNTTVQQFSPMTKKWIVPETKNDNMDEWIFEHICLGDVCDGVPKVVEHTEFSDNFLKYLDKNDITIGNPYDFKNSDIDPNIKRKLLSEFDIYKTNRKGESTGVKDVYKDVRFGPTNLHKEIKKHGSLDAWLDTHPLYRPHYERNFTLVMEEGIPDDIRSQIISGYSKAKTKYNNPEFEKYLNGNHLKSFVVELPTHFKITHELSADDFDW